jgi:hypothetical protein
MLIILVPSLQRERGVATIQGYSNSYVQLSDGRYVFANGNSLKIYDQLLNTKRLSLKLSRSTQSVVGSLLSIDETSLFKIDLSKNTPVEESVVAITEQGSSAQP